MGAPIEDPARAIQRLQRCINDLVSMLALPAMWTGGEASQIITTLLDALLAMLDLDLIYIRLRDPAAGAPAEMMRIAETWDARPFPQELGPMLHKWLGDDPQAWPNIARKPIKDQNISLMPLRLGLNAEIGGMVAGSRREGFPGETEQLMLSVAANEAAIGLQGARLLGEQKRVVSELDERVAQRTAELAATNDELRKEIADRKQTEAKLRLQENALREAHAQIARSEERWRSVFQNSAVGVALTDVEGRFIATNPVFQEMLGYTEPELQSLSFLSITHEAYREHNRMLVGELLDGTRQQFQIEKQYRRKDGNFVWVRNNVSLVPGTERTPRFLMALSEDITERKQAEEDLLRSEAFLAEGQRLSRTGSFSWRVETGEIAWSDELYRIFAFDPGSRVTLELIGSRVHPEDLPTLDNMVERAHSAARDFEYEHRILLPDGSVKYIHLIAHGSRDKDGKLEYIGAAQDVTQRRLSEEALVRAGSQLANVSRVTSLGMLTASIAHEVNQPLAGIVTNAGTCLRMLSADPPNIEGARETARRTIRDGNRASAVITRLRTLYSKNDLSPQAMDLNEAIREVISLLMSQIQRNRIILRLDLADGLPPITGDRVQLQQVILNLLHNATDAMTGIVDRPRDLLVKTESDEADRVLVTVKDSGLGFDPHAADRLFQAFYTTKNEGMGMGLSISRSIIERHQGRLWGTANDGPGATFSFSIPCRTAGVARNRTDADRADTVTDAA